MKNFTEKLCRILTEEQVHENEPMSRRTTFRAGGAADWLVEPDTEGSSRFRGIFWEMEAIFW